MAAETLNSPPAWPTIKKAVVGPAEVRGGTKALVGAAAACAAAALTLALAPPAGGVVVPSDVAQSCWFQTNGRSADLASGDWYTSVATASGDRLHRVQVDIPPGAAFPVTIRIRDAESRAGAADHDEIRGTRDPTRFRLLRPDGTSVAQTFHAASPNGSSFAITVTAANGPGTYVVTSETGAFPISGDETASVNDDENAFRVEVTPDGFATTGAGDDVDVGFTQTTLACTDTKVSLSFAYDVPAGTTVTKPRNFDLDAPGRVTGPIEYVSPDGSVLTGTMSADEVWNGGGTLDDGGDTIPVDAAGEGRWTVVVFGVNAANQVLFEVEADGARLPLSLTQRPDNVAPTATLEASSTAEEGGPFQLSLLGADDADGEIVDLRFFFDCGDGVLNGPQLDSSTSCVAGNDGTPTVRGKVVDGEGGENVYTAQLDVTNVAPDVSPASTQIVPLRPRASVRLGGFVDPGPDGPWLLDVDWGDGTASTTRQVASPGTLPRLPHRYPRVGLYRVTVTVTDDHEPASASFDVRVRRLCVVPDVRRKKLAWARIMLRARDCRLGTVTRRFSARVAAGRVIAQKRAVGKILPRGTRVGLVVSKGRR